MTFLDLYKGPWQDVPWLIQETRKFYETHVTPKGLGDQYTLAADRIVKIRKWEPALPLIKWNLEAMVRELGIFYVPKQLKPGPCIAFPLLDYNRKIVHAQIKPLYEVISSNGPLKYVRLGDKNAVRGPVWFGDTDNMLLSIVKRKSVCLVEGYFDLLACRVLHSEAAVLSTGTKSLNDMHIEYLRLLGTRKIHILFDNDIAKEGRREGAGAEAARMIANKYTRKYPDLEFIAEVCPASDPSDCLCDRRTAYALEEQLRRIFPVNGGIDLLDVPEAEDLGIA